MSDVAHKLTDKIIASTEKGVVGLYGKEYKELRKELKEVIMAMNFKSDLTPIERYNLAVKYDRLSKLQDKMVNSIIETNKKAIQQVNTSLANIYKTNYNYGIDDLAVLLAVSIPKKKATINTQQSNNQVKQDKSPMNEIAIDELKDRDLIKRQLAREFTYGIMKGETPEQLVKRFKHITEVKMSDVVRIARTQATRIENQARLDAYKVGEDMGYVVIKEWVTVGDDKVRETHRKANGQRVKNHEKFIVGGEELLCPGDPNGSAGNVINCRCYMRAGIVSKK